MLRSPRSSRRGKNCERYGEHLLHSHQHQAPAIPPQQCPPPRRTTASIPLPPKTPDSSRCGYFAHESQEQCLPCARGWPGLPLTCCCGSRRCAGGSCGHSRRAGSRRLRSPSTRAGSGHSGALPLQVCRGSHRCWGRRRCGDPGAARPIPAGGRSRLRGHRGGSQSWSTGGSLAARRLGNSCPTVILIKV